MRKTAVICILIFFCFAINVYSQARRELNFGLLGVNYEIPVHRDVTIAPGASTNFDLNWLTFYVRGNYYFDNLFEITNEAWDVYGGASAGFAVYNGNKNKSNGFDIGLQVGGRWFWSDKWGLYVELGGGSIQGASGGIGVTLKL
jgi:hypothetical protein